MGTKTLIFTLFVQKSTLLHVCSSYYSIFWISETSAKNFSNFCTDHVVGNFHQIHVILSKLLLFCKKNDYIEFCYLSLFKCIFEALRSISGGSFQAEGMCRSLRTNQIWSLQRPELSGTRSILNFETSQLVNIPMHKLKIQQNTLVVNTRDIFGENKQPLLNFSKTKISLRKKYL